jgi:hypothetical protein
MKKLVSIALIFTVLLSSCANTLEYENSQGNKVTAHSVGLFNQDDKDPNVVYKLCVGNTIWSIVLVQTLVAPIYFVGWSILEPVSVRQQAPIVSPEVEAALLERTLRRDSLERVAKEEQDMVVDKVGAHLDVAAKSFFGGDTTK